MHAAPAASTGSEPSIETAATGYDQRSRPTARFWLSRSQRSNLLLLGLVGAETRFHASTRIPATQPMHLVCAGSATRGSVPTSEPVSEERRPCNPRKRGLVARVTRYASRARSRCRRARATRITASRSSGSAASRLGSEHVTPRAVAPQRQLEGVVAVLAVVVLVVGRSVVVVAWVVEGSAARVDGESWAPGRSLGLLAPQLGLLSCLWR